MGNSERPSLLLVGGGGAHRALRDASRLRGSLQRVHLKDTPHPVPRSARAHPVPQGERGRARTARPLSMFFLIHTEADLKLATARLIEADPRLAAIMAVARPPPPPRGARGLSRAPSLAL